MCNVLSGLYVFEKVLNYLKVLKSGELKNILAWKACFDASFQHTCKASN